MTRRTYNQYCGLSRGLDLVGERWTLPIIRELMSGPKRYTDLAAVLDGIGTSLLASRMKQLIEDGLVTRTELPPPAASQVYELTEAGDELAAALVPLAIWGIRHCFDEPRRRGEHYRAEWTLVFLAALIDRRATVGKRAVIQFIVEGSDAALSIDDGAVTVTPGRVAGADARIETDLPTLLALGAGELDPGAVGERVRLTGDPTVALYLLELIRRDALAGGSGGSWTTP